MAQSPVFLREAQMTLVYGLGFQITNCSLDSVDFLEHN